MNRPPDEREDASREGKHDKNRGGDGARHTRQGHIAPKRDYEALWKHPTVVTQTTNPHAAAFTRRPETTKVHELNFWFVAMADRGGQRKGQHRQTQTVERSALIL